ncbi:transporter substrate-binding domain-containing protein [Vibrio profundum]|uniref:substrate-binding periplasmic protein n=1 Tax=Vibrio profundum TaxID=2910247 RepID=UPI003D1136D7
MSIRLSLIVCLTASLYILPLGAEEVSGSCFAGNVSLCEKGKNGQPTGLAVDILQELARRIEVDIVITPRPIKRTLLNLKQGVTDIVAPIQYNESRSEFVYYLSTPIIQGIKASIYGRQGRKFTFDDIHSLYGKTIGIRRGYYFSKDLSSAIKENKFKVIETNSHQQLLALLKKDRVDYIVMAAVSFEQHQGNYSFIEYGKLRESFDILVGVSKNGKLMAHIEQLNRALEQISQDGTLHKLKQRYPEYSSR